MTSPDTRCCPSCERINNYPGLPKHGCLNPSCPCHLPKTCECSGTFKVGETVCPKCGLPIKDIPGLKTCMWCGESECDCAGKQSAIKDTHAKTCECREPKTYIDPIHLVESNCHNCCKALPEEKRRDFAGNMTVTKNPTFPIKDIPAAHDANILMGELNDEFDEPPQPEKDAIEENKRLANHSIVYQEQQPAPWDIRFDEFFKMYDLNSQTVKSFIAKEIFAAEKRGRDAAVDYLQEMAVLGHSHSNPLVFGHYLTETDLEAARAEH